MTTSKIKRENGVFVSQQEEARSTAFVVFQ